MSDHCSIPCNLCGSYHVKEVGVKDRDGGPLRTVMCRMCGLAWTDPRPRSSEVSEYYANDYRLEYKGSFTPKLKQVYRAGRSCRIVW